MKWRGVSEKIEAPATGPLSERLQEIKARTYELARPENLQIQERAIAELEASRAAEHILSVGSNAPEFELLDANGRLVRSADLLARGPLVILFFRGRWCPYCVATLEAWQEIYPAMQQLGASLVAISPQTLKQTSLMAEQHQLRFPVLSDAEGQVAQQFKVAYKLPADLQELDRRIFINLEFINGNKNWELPMPGMFVVASDRTVLFAETQTDYTQRTEPERVLQLLSRTHS